MQHAANLASPREENQNILKDGIN
uniref:Uncharacterized protein n=1 Tax=Triticum urartu TaxID=4572 RepID=A0A8R7TNN8_TRIUA